MQKAMTTYAPAEDQVDGFDGVVQKRLDHLAGARLLVAFQLILGKRLGCDIGNRLVQYGKISRLVYINAQRVGQPQEVIAAPRAHALIAATHPLGARMPPMLDVAFLKLMRGRRREVRACDLRHLVHYRTIS